MLGSQQILGSPTFVSPTSYQTLKLYPTLRLIICDALSVELLLTCLTCCIL